ncbi:SusD/RagB family nutrient-binding outer membrane lipoprotein [Dyadobacter sp. CY312]|uniref:SusD/RagB family nutrient-binding outer membrane lipoprotein n=1 Tax=Dyadobacter sp. CY312 TaxID=2907303 RepID=UPI001F342CC3|nr:SusD/RagB family nutrient-binding outer membrane lipoprotein [Dyadobacter sp. CY312]MCE7043748.1 SusD/RagB family nutrient-binding outer membrane lipoprotein [Dyadobacter sp. CY312]
MMKKLKYLILSLAVSLASCEDITDLQKDPGAITSPSADLIFTGILLNSYDSPWSLDQRHNQYMTQNEAYYEGQPYSWTTGSYDVFYTSLRNVNQMEQVADQAGAVGAQYKTMAKFFKAYFYARATEMFGDVPMTEAIQGVSSQNFKPKYDSQKDIYLQVLKWLDEANAEMPALIANRATLPGDFIYNGDLSKWQKLINSFRLRTLISLSKRADDTPELNVKQQFSTILSNPDKYPLVLTNADNFQIVYNTFNTYPLWPSNGVVVKNDKRNTLGATYTNIAKTTRDPRLMVVALPAEALAGNQDAFAKYAGGKTGDLQSTLLDQAGKGLLSMINFDFWEASAAGVPAIQLGASEVNFLIAEGINRGWATGNAANYYKAGIEESMKFYNIGTADVASFIASNPYPATQAAALNKILEQKYMSFFENSGKQAYYQYRRTGVPTFDVGQSNGNNNQIPTRWAYPTSEYTTNEANVKASIQVQYNGADTQNGGMWLAK